MVKETDVERAQRIGKQAREYIRVKLSEELLPLMITDTITSLASANYNLSEILSAKKFDVMELVSAKNSVQFAETTAGTIKKKILEIQNGVNVILNQGSS